MRYYPVQLDIRGRSCLVVGGGAVGTRKVAGLLDCGARVAVVSPEATDTLRRLAAEGRIALELRDYRPGDLGGVFLVIGATDDEALNRRLSADAGTAGILCNIADRPEACNFILPAVVKRGDLVLTVSTSGKSPALAKKLRMDLERQFGGEYGRLLELMGALRRRLLAEAHAPEAHKPLFEAIVQSDILALIRENRTEDIDRLLERTLGEGYRFDELMKTTPNG
jgi:precorrin-2 dehydrogenase/sirohydrochlorin ferrochelatase